MSTFTLPTASGEYADGETAQGTEVRADLDYIVTNLNNATLNNVNVNTATTWPWTGRHSWVISDASNDNLSLTVSAVLAAAKYGFHFASSAAQVNSALIYVELTNASSTVPCIELANAGSGSSFKVTNTGTSGIGYEGLNTSTSATTAPFKSNQAGTGNNYDAVLRTMTTLNAPLTASIGSATNSVTNSTTETAFTTITKTIPANFLKAGTTITGKVFGTMDTPGAAPATARFLVRLGGTSGTILLDSGAFTPTVSLSNSLVVVDFALHCISTGATGTMEAQGVVACNSNTAPALRGMGTAGTGAGNGAVITIDTTAEKDLVVDFVWGTAVASCTFTWRAGSVTINR